MAILEVEVQAAAGMATQAGFDYGLIDEGIRDEVKAAARSIHQLSAGVMTGIIAIGKRLIEVKGMIPHGQFADWVVGEFQMEPRMAQNYMNVAREYGDPQKRNIISLFSPTVAYLLAAPSTPEEARVEVEQAALSGAKVTVDMAKKAAAKFSEPKPSKPRAEIKRVVEPYQTPAPTPAKVTYLEPRVAVDIDEPADDLSLDERAAMAIVATEQAEEDAERAARAATRLNFENVPEPVAAAKPQPASILTPAWVIFVLVNYTPASADFAVALKAATPDDLREAMCGFDQEERHWRARLAAIKARMTELETPDPRIARAREGMELITAGRAWVRDNYLDLTGKEINTLAYWRDTSEMLGDLESLVDILTGKDVTK